MAAAKKATDAAPLIDISLATPMIAFMLASFALNSYAYEFGFFNGTAPKLMSGFTVGDLLLHGGIRVGDRFIMSVGIVGLMWAYERWIGQGAGKFPGVKRWTRIGSVIIFTLFNAIMTKFLLVAEGSSSGLITSFWLASLLSLAIMCGVLIFDKVFFVAAFVMYVTSLMFISFAVGSNDAGMLRQLTRNGSDVTCATLQNDTRCWPVIFMGSQSALLRGSSHVVLVDRKEIRTAQTPVENK